MIAVIQSNELFFKLQNNISFHFILSIFLFLLICIFIFFSDFLFGTYIQLLTEIFYLFKFYINFKEKMLREGIILKYFSYILINITRGTQK